MRICRFNEGRLGIVISNGVADVTHVLERLPAQRWPFPAADQFILHLDELRPHLEAALKDAAIIPLSQVKMLSPIGNPGKVIAAPVNYRLHLDESRADKGIHFGSHVKTIDECGVFLKANSSVVGAAHGVVSERSDRRTDHEIELAFVIGRRGRNISEADALDYVAGYFIGLDMTIRGPEERSFR